MAPRSNVMRAPSVPRVATQAQTQFRQAPRNFTPSVARSQRNNNSPSIAFGGHVIDNNNTAAVNAGTRRSFATTPSAQQQFTTRRGDTRDFRVPSETSRNWDRGRVHEWNRHHFRFSGGTWVIIDPGIYDYGYPYDDYGVTTYSSPGYAYDYSSDSLVMGAQDRLNRLGYSAGPADGVIGPQTRDAIADFQNDNRLPATGHLDTATVRALGL